MKRLLREHRKVIAPDYKVTLRFLTRGSKERDHQMMRSEVTKYFLAINRRGK